MGLALGGAALAVTAGFGTAKLRTDIVATPVLAKELRYVDVQGWVESRELGEQKSCPLDAPAYRPRRVAAEGDAISRSRDRERQVCARHSQPATLSR